ncbi:MAG: hypothetical protein JWQ89_639 [Devosia sp.]|uniref:hypothetical protein n=1 Tax=Devosia sp. TaxID=1871048 RepID=UPI00260551AE|nr:hypothetical protein [Devosia sp.]MDB5538912.1 hypothetical protein [Devosia sp.]
MIRTLIPALALAGVMMTSSGAMAQTVVGGISVSTEQLPAVQAACDTLATRELALSAEMANSAALASSAALTTPTTPTTTATTTTTTTPPDTLLPSSPITTGDLTNEISADASANLDAEVAAAGAGAAAASINPTSPTFDLSLLNYDSCQAAGLIP